MQLHISCGERVTEYDLKRPMIDRQIDSSLHIKKTVDTYKQMFSEGGLIDK